MSLVGRLSLDLAQQQATCPLDPGGRLVGGTLNLLPCGGKHTGLIGLRTQDDTAPDVSIGVDHRRGSLAVLQV